MNNLYASLALLLFLAFFGNGKAIAQIENNLADASIYITPGTILYVANDKTADSEVIFVSKNTLSSSLDAFTKSVIVYEETKPAIRTKAILKKKATLPKPIASVSAEKLNEIPFSESKSETKIISGTASVPVSPTASPQSMLIKQGDSFIFFGITTFQSFQRKGFLFLEIKQFSNTDLFARPPTFILV